MEFTEKHADKLLGVLHGFDRMIFREYLKRALNKEGIKYESYDNSLPLIEDIGKAQEIIDKLENKKWDRFFDVIAKEINPLLPEI